MLTDHGRACLCDILAQVKEGRKSLPYNRAGANGGRVREIRAESIVHCAFSALAELAGGTPALPGCEKHVGWLSPQGEVNFAVVVAE